ncbi:uncharacterized protein LOC144467334 [Epinephelus lanceolatus]
MAERPAEGELPLNKTRSVAKRAWDRERDKTRVNIGVAFQRWRALRAAKGLQLDAELALLLLDSYENNPAAQTAPKTSYRGVHPPDLSNTDQGSASDRFGATMDTRLMNDVPVTAADETTHYFPENLGPPAEEILEVLIEEDIIGSRASILYEENIRQLATLVHLPVKHCPHMVSTGQLCQSLPPFACSIQQRCTAFVVEWVCPRGHVVWSWTSQPTFKFGMLAGDLLLGMNILLSGNSYAKVALLFRFMNMGVVNPVTFFKIQDSYCVDAIKEFWMERRAKAIQRLQGKDEAGSEVQQQLLVVKEEVPPEQQEWSSSVDQEDPEPPHIKEEEEELWSSQEGEQLQGLEEADITKFTFTPVPVKSEDDEEKSQSEGHHCGGPGAGPGPVPEDSPEPYPDIDDRTGDSLVAEIEVSLDDLDETKEPQSGLNSPKTGDVPISDSRRSVREKPFSCSECGKRFGIKTSVNRHMRCHTGEKRFSCSVCQKSFSQSGYLHTHMRIHTGEKRFSCSVCDQRFSQKTHLNRHMITHTGEKPFSCSICGKAFSENGNLKKHMITHTGEKPFSCSVCGKGFIQKVNLTNHMTYHTGEKPYSCSVCLKGFMQKINLKLHMAHHTGEKPFGCTICDKRFASCHRLKRHKCGGRRSARLRWTQTEDDGGVEPPDGGSTQQTETNTFI